MEAETLIKRIPPHSLEAEQSVIGAMFLGKEAIAAAAEVLSPEDFYARQYGILFEAMTELYNAGQAVDTVTILAKLEEKQAPPEIRNVNFLAGIINMVPTSVNIRSYAQIVYDNAVKRRLIKINEEIADACYKGADRTEDILADTEKRILELLSKRGGSERVPIDKMVLEVLKSIQDAARAGSSITGLETGFTGLDEKTAGFQNSDLILIAARPSMGKTAFALNIAQFAAFRNGKRVMVFSLEMSSKSLVNRLLAMGSYVDSEKIRIGNLEDEEWDRVMEEAGVIGRSNLEIAFTPGITVTALRSMCIKQKLERGLDMVMIDYLQLMSGNNSKREQNRQQEISEISRSLKALAMELDVPVVALSQLSRGPEQRPDHRPNLADLRESGAIEQDADVVMFIYRDDYYHPDTDRKNIADIMIQKNRNGAIGTVQLAWMPKFTKFGNPDFGGRDK